MIKQLSSLLCFILPVTTALFLVSGPHGMGAALAWTLPLWGLVIADWLSPKVKPQQDEKTPDGFYNGILYSLAFLQFLNIGLMLVYVSRMQWNTPEEITTGLVNLIAVRIMVGTSSGSSGIIVAHELIHRSRLHMQYLGRLLLCTVCYEHFALSHQQGHHRSVGKPHDITTAHLGESFHDYWRRVYKEHFRYAWRSELARLGIKHKPFGYLSIIQNQVLHGLFFEMALVILITVFFGWIALFAFLYQSFAAVRLLETINYYQHWGLEDNPGNSLAWVNDSWLTTHVLLGLSNHIDHHENPSRHYQDIAYSDQGPKMPYGYFVMNLWIKLNNASYRRMAVRELEKLESSLTA